MRLQAGSTLRIGLALHECFSGNGSGLETGLVRSPSHCKALRIGSASVWCFSGNGSGLETEMRIVPTYRAAAQFRWKWIWAGKGSCPVNSALQSIAHCSCSKLVFFWKRAWAGNGSGRSRRHAHLVPQSAGVFLETDLGWERIWALSTSLVHPAQCIRVFLETDLGWERTWTGPDRMRMAPAGCWMFFWKWIWAGNSLGPVCR